MKAKALKTKGATAGRALALVEPKPELRQKPAPFGGQVGRKKGSINRVSRMLKDAAILASENVGNGLKGKKHKKGLVSYLERCARYYPEAYLTFLGKILPMQVAVKTEIDVKAEFRTVEEVREELRNRGIIIEGSVLDA